VLIGPRCSAVQCPECGSVGRPVHWGNRLSHNVILSYTRSKYHGDGGQVLHAVWTKCCLMTVK
jgi:hypothetical protein